MKVRIENNSSSSITVKGRHTIRIPEHGIFEATLPDTVQIKNTINRLRREYPALKILIEQGDVPGKDAKPANSESQKQEPGNMSEPLTKDVFVAQAKASKTTGNKWNVKIGGITLEVAEAADKAAAIEAAYALYVEGVATPNTGEDKQQ